MYHPQSRPAAPPAPREAARRPARVVPVPGSGYGLAIYGAPPATSGPAVGALVTGIAAILVSLVVGCFGFAGVAAVADGQPGAWGPLVGGAFAVLATCLGLAGIGLGSAGVRQTRVAGHGPGEPVGGRAMAVAGITCGGAGVIIAVCSVGLAGLAVLA